jgi:hypothetical protein
MCIDRAEVAQRDGGVVMAGADGQLERAQRGLQELDGSSWRPVVSRMAARAARSAATLGVIGTAAALADRHGPAGRCLAFDGTTGGVAQAAEVVQHGRDQGDIAAELAHERAACLPAHCPRRWVGLSTRRA